MAVLLGVCNWVHPLLQSPSCCKKLKEAGIDAIQLDLGSAEEDFPLSSPGIQRQWKEEAELYGIRLDAVVVLAVLKHGMTAEPGSERRNTAEKAIAAAVDCCYFPLYEIERGITALNYDPASSNKKIPVTEWLGMMGRTRHLLKEEYRSVTEEIQKEIDRRYDRLKARAEHPLL